MKKLMLFAVMLALGFSTGHAQILITEIDANGSGASYGADWFELTNYGASAVNISGWKMDDNSNLFASAVALNGVTSIGAGQSVIFVEGTSTQVTGFINAWYGGTLPSNTAVGSYTGSGVGLSGTADAVNVFDGSGTLITRLDFGASTTATFINPNQLDNVTIATHSSNGVLGAYTVGSEIGSPGVVPEPSTYALMIGGLLTLLFIQARRNRA